MFKPQVSLEWVNSPSFEGSLASLTVTPLAAGEAGLRGTTRAAERLLRSLVTTDPRSR
jgi:hypothetical protein